MATLTKRKTLAAAALAALLLPVAALAQDDPVNRSRGLSANAAYAIGDIDAVNGLV